MSCEVTKVPEPGGDPTIEVYTLHSDESESDDNEGVPSFSGTLQKWTNYLHGWQKRFFLLSDRTLAYYKSEEDSGYGCRGAISIDLATIQHHEFDECRFDISVSDCVWYLRAESLEDRQKWIEALEAHKSESGYGSQSDLRRHGSAVSLQSLRSLTSASSFKKGRGLQEKVDELETFRDIVCRQVDNLQSYFDACVSNSPSVLDKTLEEEDNEVDTAGGEASMKTFTKSHSRNASRDSNVSSFSNDDRRYLPPPPPLPGLSSPMDFKGEALTFKATTAGIVATLQHIVELVNQREDMWRRRLDRETDKRKKCEEILKTRASENFELKSRKPIVVYGGPDFEEGPNSVLNEEEWHDAVDAALDREDIEDARLQRCMSADVSKTNASPSPSYDNLSLPKGYYLYQDIEKLTTELLRYSVSGVKEVDGWELFAEDGPMKMYRREVEIDGLVMDPLKALHTVKGVTAHEYCHYFFAAEYKLDWDTSLENVRLIERVSADTLVLHQLHKRIWPSSQRESLFWSHFRRVDACKDRDALDLYAVVNHDILRKDVPIQSGCLRVGLSVAMVCQTVLRPGVTPATARRGDLTTRVIYVSEVNPGGWTPPAVLRLVYKREYPKFLKRFTQYVQQKTINKQILF